MFDSKTTACGGHANAHGQAMNTVGMTLRPHLIAPALMCGLLLTSCATSTVLVSDERNAPVAGAHVEPFSPNIRYPALTTNAAGIVKIPPMLQKTDAINVSKDGFIEAWAVRLKAGGVTKVVLKSAAK